MEREKWQQVYHFTSLRNLERIVQSGYIALSDVTKSNDPAEGVYVLDTLRTAYEEQGRDGEITEEQFIRIHRLFFDFAEKEKIGGRLQQIIFSLSFCEPENSLALWRIYGDQGRGVAIGMAKEMLKDIERNDPEHFRFAQIQYFEEKELIRQQKEFWKKHQEDGDDVLLEALREQYINGYFMKRIENAYEKEWRLIYVGFRLENYRIPTLELDVAEEIDAHEKAGDLVFYYKLPVNQERRIEHVSLGPLCKVKACEMIAFLKRHHVQNLGINYSFERMR